MIFMACLVLCVFFLMSSFTMACVDEHRVAKWMVVIAGVFVVLAILSL